MSKASDAANAVVWSINQTCALYGVKTLRIQSRTFQVEGVAGRMRPMSMGAWVDDFGKMHTRGIADLLARPRVPMWALVMPDHSKVHLGMHYEKYGDPIGWATDCLVTVPLWIEAKSGKGRLTPDQLAFKANVEKNGEQYLVIHDDLRPLIEWFETRGVKR